MRVPFKVKGVVRLERKTQEGVIFEVIEKENVFTKFGLQQSLNLTNVLDTYTHVDSLNIGSVGAPVFLSTSTVTPTEGNPIVNNIVREAIWDFDNPLPRATWTDSTASLPMYGEIRVRLDAPGAPLSFQTIAVADPRLQADLTGNLTWNVGSRGRAPIGGLTTVWAHSYVLLDSPVVQGELEVIDVFYRLYFIPANGQGMPKGDKVVRNIGRRLFGQTNIQPWTSNTVLLTPVNFDNPEDYNVIYHLSERGRVDALANIEYFNATSYNSSTAELTKSYSTTSLSSSTGRVIKSFICLGGEESQFAVTARNFVDPSRSKLQTTWAKRNGATPFFSDDDFAIGVGRITRSEAWTGDYPEFYKIIITQSGAIGTSEYRVERMLFTHFWDNRWFQIPAMVPQLGRADSTRYTELTRKEGYGLNQRNRFIKHNRRQVIFYDTQGVSLVDILDSSIFRDWGQKTETINPLDKLDVTNITQVYSDGTIIYVACRNTGLWEIDTTKDLGVTGYVTNVIAGNCYGVTGVNYAGSLDIVAVTPTGLTTKSQAYGTVNTPFSTRITNVGMDSVKWIEGNTAPGFTDGEVVMMSELSSSNKQLVWWSRASNTMIDGIATAPGVGVTGTWLNLSSLPGSVLCSPISGWWGISFAGHPSPTGADVYWSFGRTSYGSSSFIKCGFYNSLLFSTDYLTRTPIFDFDKDDRAIAFVYSTWKSNFDVNIRGYRFGFDATTNSTVGLINYANPQFITDTGVCVENNSSDIEYHQAERLLFLDREEYLLTFLGSIVMPIYQNWTPYGWDGSQWVRGSTASKPTHVVEEPILNGISVGFDDKSATNPFFASDFYTIPICDGIIVDNAKRVSHSIVVFGNNYRFQVEFPTGGSALVVPNVSPYQLGVPGASEGGFLEMDVSSVKSFKILLDGFEIPFENVLTDGSTPPATNIVSVDLPSGTLTFHPSDANKTISGYYSYSLNI